MSSSGYTPWSVSGGEVPTTAYWNLLGSNDASFNTGNGFNDGIIIPRHIGTDTSWAWTSFTPVWTASSSNPAIGNGTLSGAYMQIGKTIFYRFYMTTGSTTTFGSGFWKFSLPLNAKTTGPSGGAGFSMATYHTSGTNSHAGTCYPVDASNLVWDAAEARANWNATAPFTWTTSGDTLYGQMIYEAA